MRGQGGRFKELGITHSSRLQTCAYKWTHRQMHGGKALSLYFIQMWTNRQMYSGTIYFRRCSDGDKIGTYNTA